MIFYWQYCYHEDGTVNHAIIKGETMAKRKTAKASKSAKSSKAKRSTKKAGSSKKRRSPARNKLGQFASKRSSSRR